jgi:hypothetical protein
MPFSVTPLHHLDDDEFRHELATFLAWDDLPPLLSWLTEHPHAPARVDRTLTELGLPEPDHDEHGEPIPGSILRKVLHWSQVDHIAEFLTVAGVSLREAA